jgi:hypothetical protein
VCFKLFVLTAVPSVAFFSSLASPLGLRHQIRAWNARRNARSLRNRSSLFSRAASDAGAERGYDRRCRKTRRGSQGCERARWKGERRRSSAKNPLHDLLLVLQNRRQGNRPDWPCVGADPIRARHAIIGRLACTGMFRPERAHNPALEPPNKAMAVSRGQSSRSPGVQPNWTARLPH